MVELKTTGETTHKKKVLLKKTRVLVIGQQGSFLPAPKMLLESIRSDVIRKIVQALADTRLHISERIKTIRENK